MHTIACVHCKASLEDKRKGTKYCSDKCRKAFIRSSTKTTRKAKPLYECKFCGKQTKNKCYCNRECWSLHTKKKRKRRVLASFPRTRFGVWLLENVKRAGTVQVLENTTHQDFTELLLLYKRMSAAKGVGNRGRGYVLAHLSPVKGVDSVGRLNASNLILAPERLNQQLSNKEFGHTCRVLKADLLPSYEVIEKMSDNKVMSLINKITKGEFYRFVRSEKLHVPARSKSNTSYTKEPYALVDVVREEVGRLHSRVDLFDTPLWQELHRIYDRCFDPKRFIRTRKGGNYELQLTTERAEEMMRLILENRLSEYEIPDSCSLVSGW